RHRFLMKNVVTRNSNLMRQSPSLFRQELPSRTIVVDEVYEFWSGDSALAEYLLKLLPKGSLYGGPRKSHCGHGQTEDVTVRSFTEIDKFGICDTHKC